ncbi:putative nucleotidyltransferase, ribonuclease H [Tanacetum coccineum]
MDAGYIRPSKAPYGALVLFQRNKDRSLRMCIDYRALNKVIIKNKYPIPLIADLFDQLGKERYFTKLDLRLGCYQVRIAEGDEAKTTCVTRYGSYEFLVMPFGLTNAPTTFCTLVNKLFHLFLDKFMMVYLDDIVVYGHSLDEHVLHLKQVLRYNKLYVKLENYSFAQDKVEFLGHKIKDGGFSFNIALTAWMAWERSGGYEDEDLGLENSEVSVVGGKGLILLGVILVSSREEIKIGLMSRAAKLLPCGKPFVGRQTLQPGSWEVDGGIFLLDLSFKALARVVLGRGLCYFCILHYNCISCLG